MRFWRNPVKREKGATANDPFVVEHSNEALVENGNHRALGQNPRVGETRRESLWRLHQGRDGLMAIFDQPRTYGGPNPAFIIYTRKQQTHEL